MRLGITTIILNRHSGLSFRENGTLSPKHEDEPLSCGRLRVCARNDGKRPRIVPWSRVSQSRVKNEPYGTLAR